MGAAEEMLAHMRAVAAEEAKKVLDEALRRFRFPNQVVANDKDYLSTKEAAKLLKCTTRTIMNRIDAGMPHHRVGHAYRFKRDELEAWMKQKSRSK
jgi:excisionase family DNA binding protein